MCNISGNDDHTNLTTTTIILLDSTCSAELNILCSILTNTYKRHDSECDDKTTRQALPQEN